MDRLEAQQLFWRNQAATYEQRFALNTEAGQAKVKRRAKMLYEGLDKSMNVLELGCGTGVYTAELAQRVKHVLAIDISHEMLALAHHIRNVDYAYGDAHSLKFTGFEAVVGAYVLQYLDLSIALPNIYQSLVAGGTVAFLEPSALNPYTYFATRTAIGKRLLHRPHDTNSFLIGELVEAFQAAGFQHINVRLTEWHMGSLIIRAAKCAV